MIGEFERQMENKNPELEKWLKDMEEEQKEFDFIKIDFLIEIREAEKRYKNDYKNNVNGTRDCQLSFNQWLECKKYEASKFYMKHSDYYL